MAEEGLLSGPKKRKSPRQKALSALAGLLALFVVLVGGLGAATAWDNGSWSPKLALDLEGGTQMILAPEVTGGGDISGEQLDQAVEIIRQRVDGTGVAEAEISTQSGKNVVVSLPGIPDEATRKLIQASAQMFFRPVLEIGAATPVETAGEPAAPAEKPKNNSDLNWITPEVRKQFDALDCTAEGRAAASKAERTVPDPALPMAACDVDEKSPVKYLLGPVDIFGTELTNAENGLGQSPSGVSTNNWVVNLRLNGEGSKKFQEVSTRLNGFQGVRRQFAIVLDDKVISAPEINSTISDGQAQISGPGFNQETTQELAQQLKYGSLPISFTIQSDEQVSASLGSEQLRIGLLAGAIGLALVVVYSIFQYRALAVVTIASLAVAGALTYVLVSLFSWGQGYRLSLAGVAGLIVAIGITADSFIVYFERVRDELRDGRGLVSSVETGWKRAFRTILASDTVNFLAAVVLFFLAVGNVRGFAFTLGLTTLVDLVVVALFTHPMMQLLARVGFFKDGHPWSGLSAKQLGTSQAAYRGRGAVRSTGSTARRGGKSPQEVPLTLAERRAAEAARDAGSIGGPDSALDGHHDDTGRKDTHV